MTFAINHQWSDLDLLKAGEAKGRRPGRLPGGHIDDLASLFKAVALCRNCVGKFNYLAYGYVTKQNLPLAQGRCDGCDQFSLATLFVHHTLADNC